MNKDCKNCSKQFEITNQDIEFLEKISPVFNGKVYKIPPPTLCPQCRQQRRLAYRNERTLYNRKCDLTGQDIISIYAPEKPHKIYEPQDWWSDKWDAMEYGRDFDFNRPFFEQYRELQEQVPRMALHIQNLENSPYVNQVWNSKNSYLTFDAGFSEDIHYCYATYHSNNLFDCSFVRNSDFSYWLMDNINCHNSIFLQECRSCFDSYFSYDCFRCNNVAFCYNLKDKKNYIFNKQVSEEEFKEFANEIKSGSYKKFVEYANDYYEKVFSKAIHRENHNINVENCIGDHLFNSKNCNQCFDCESSEDIKYCTRADEKVINCIDVDHCAFAELSYEALCTASNNSKFTNVIISCNDSMYIDIMQSCSDCFGCIGLKNKKYCILNKQYTKEEYEKLIPKIIEHMIKTGEWGEFFPIKTSPFAYNESVAQDYHPLTKEEALSKGYDWRDPDSKRYQKQTINLPDNIDDILDSITKEVLACGECGKNYKITPQELKFYRKTKLPIPRSCPNCRNAQRVKLRNPRKLCKLKCDKCKKEIQTTYPEDHAETIYCKSCYLKTIY